MPILIMPRAYPQFDPVVHVAKPEHVARKISCVMVGVDVGSSAPCVALHGALYPDGSMRIFREEFEVGVGLVAFVDGGTLAHPQCVDVVCAERACIAHNPVTNQSAKGVIEVSGHRVMVCKSSPSWRHRAINARLNAGLSPGGIVIDPSCTNLIACLIGHRQAFAGGSKWRSTTPRYMHASDALGYLVEGFARWRSLGLTVDIGMLVDETA